MPRPGWMSGSAAVFLLRHEVKPVVGEDREISEVDGPRAGGLFAVEVVV